ncbi:MAG TPA: gamma carbonic anhydrase family protein [Gemmataceae bacterium]|jgi:carbonic anhydrase/acetyltransferase-like protein (isoleucine patch superfamily)
MAGEPLMRKAGDVYLAHTALVIGDVHLAAGVNLWFNVVVRGDLARITLGPRVNLQDGVVVHTDYDVPQDIEEGVVAGHGAILHGRRIGANCLIGMGAVILSGSEIGPESLIAAGCVVPERMVVPPRSVVAGVPGRVVKEVPQRWLERTRRINAHYLELAGRYVAGEFK